MAERVQSSSSDTKSTHQPNHTPAASHTDASPAGVGYTGKGLSRLQRTVVAMQHTHGNAAVRRMLQRASAPVSEPVSNGTPPPQPDEEQVTSAEMPSAAPQLTSDSTTLQRTVGDGHDLSSPRFAGDPVLEAAFDNERLVSVGSRGPAVQKLQQALIDLGFPLPKFGADSIFGAETRKAVKDFQSTKSLKPDGIVGPLTMGELDRASGGGGPGPTPPGPTPPGPGPTPPGPTPPGPTPPGPGPTPPAPTTVPITIGGNAELWFFNGTTPASYPLEQVLTAGSGGVAGTFNWSLNSGGTFADFSGSPTAAGATATLKSKLQSAARNDVEVKVDFVGTGGQTGTATRKFTVLAPDRLNFLRNVDKADATFAYETEIHYSILDQFGTVLPRNVPLNEQFTAAPTADFAGMDWRRGPEGGATVNPADWFDRVQGETSDKTPKPLAPGSANAGVAVYHWPGRWQIGSTTIGSGKTVRNVTWSKSRGFARHT